MKIHDLNILKIDYIRREFFLNIQLSIPKANAQLDTSTIPSKKLPKLRAVHPNCTIKYIVIACIVGSII